jgi:hypothetical protein
MPKRLALINSNSDPRSTAAQINRNLSIIDNELAAHPLKVAQTGLARTTTLVYAGAGGTLTATEAHTLGYAPVVLAFYKKPGDTVWSQAPAPVETVSGSTVTYAGSVAITCSTTDIVFSVSLDSTVAATYAGTWSFVYYVFAKSLG